jgi:hypothetical protein
MICELCTEELLPTEIRAPVFPLVAHPECLLRETQGGIGHHLNHEYWCVQMGDPDGGVSYRESARRVWKLITGEEI